MTKEQAFQNWWDGLSTVDRNTLKVFQFILKRGFEAGYDTARAEAVDIVHNLSVPVDFEEQFGYASGLGGALDALETWDSPRPQTNVDKDSPSEPNFDRLAKLQWKYGDFTGMQMYLREQRRAKNE